MAIPIYELEDITVVCPRVRYIDVFFNEQLCVFLRFFVV